MEERPENRLALAGRRVGGGAVGGAHGADGEGMSGRNRGRA